MTTRHPHGRIPVRTARRAARILAKASNPVLLENLENRRLLADITLSGGLLDIVLDNGRSNHIYLRNNYGGTAYIAELNGTNHTLNKRAIQRIRIVGGERDDYIDISQTITRPSTIIGNGGNDEIKGGSGDDLIFTGSGNDRILGRRGNDTIVSGSGRDSVYGGDGNDYLYTTGNGQLWGENGNDFLDGGGNAALFGGSGTDTGHRGRSYNSIERRQSFASAPAQPNTPNSDGVVIVPQGPTGLPSQITLAGGTLAVKMDNGRSNSFYIRAGSSSSTYLITYNGSNYNVNRSDVSRIRVDGGDRNDNIDISSSLNVPTTLNGGAGNDTIRGGSGNDLIDGGPGNDYILARDGNDTVRGGGGADSIWGGNGNDYLYGSGNGRIYGEAGNDFIDGGGGSSVADGGSGTDTANNARTYVSIEKRQAIPPFPGTGSGGGSGGGTTDPGTGGGGGTTDPRPTPTPRPRPPPPRPPPARRQLSRQQLRVQPHRRHQQALQHHRRRPGDPRRCPQLHPPRRRSHHRALRVGLRRPQRPIQPDRRLQCRPRL